MNFRRTMVALLLCGGASLFLTGCGETSAVKPDGSMIVYRYDKSDPTGPDVSIAAASAVSAAPLTDIQKKLADIYDQRMKAKEDAQKKAAAARAAKMRAAKAAQEGEKPLASPEDMKAAEELRFEDAELLKRRIQALEGYVTKSEVVSHTITDVDVFSITCDDSNAFINYMHVTSGSINAAFTYEFKKKLDESEKEILSLGIVQIREEVKSKAKEIIVPFELETELKNITVTIPQRGDKKTLLDLSIMNGKQYRFDRLKQAEKLNPEQKQTRLMKELQNALKLEKMPYQIECFDNSNISGTDAVAGCVVFKAMKPSKKDYRKYNIKTVVGPDDYASMQEVVRRRYSRMIEEQTPLPDLIITDGGRGQMEVVREVVEDELNLKIPIAGLAKDDRHRTNELLFGFPPVVIGMKTDSELFRILTQIQDEVHRFAITFHRDKRSKHALHSELDDIEGIGPKTKDLLIKKLKSVKRIKESDLQTLTEIIGASKAKKVHDYFQRSLGDIEEKT